MRRVLQLQNFFQIALLAFCTIVFAAYFSGPIRAVTGWPLAWSGVSAGLLSLTIAAYELPKVLRHRTSWQTLILGIIFFSTCFAILFYQLYNPYFDGLVSVGGGDAGEHVYYKDKFAFRSADVYNGFVGFHALAFWVERVFRADSFESFRIIFYFVVSVTVLFTTLIGIAIFSQPYAESESNSPTPVRDPLTFFLILTGIGFLPTKKVLAPLLHYLQADGYYPQLFGLVPLLALALSYALLGAWLERVAALVIAIPLLRYTYGLNLGDVLLCASVLVFYELRQHSNSRFRSLAICAPLVGAIGAAQIYSRLLPLKDIGGMTVKTLVELVILGATLMGAGLLLLARHWAAQPPRYQMRSVHRLALFTSTFLVFSSVAQLGYLVWGFEKSYYLYKYGIQPAFLGVLVCLVCTAFFLTQVVIRFLAQDSLPSTPRSGLSGIVAISLISAGVWCCIQGYRPYRPAFYERISGGPSTLHIQPLTDRRAWKIIEEVLSTNHKQFGGFLTASSWAQSQFINSAFGYHTTLPLYRSPHLRMTEGNCVFWNSLPSDIDRFAAINQSWAANFARRLGEDPSAKSVQYNTAWSNEVRQISYRCY